MRSIIHLIFLVGGFLGGIYVGVKFPSQAQNIDSIRAQEQAKLAPQISAAVAQAKIDLINKFLSDSSKPASTSTGASGFSIPGASGFAAGGTPGNSVAAPTDWRAMLASEQQKLTSAQSQISSAK